MLIALGAHDAVMVGFILISLLLIAGPLAVFAGIDSRVDEVERRRRTIT